jgi:hypothetical protein
MDVDELIEEPSWSEQRLLETPGIIESLVTQGSMTFEEESITFNHAAYNRVSKKC